MTIKIVLADDHAITREGIKSLIREEKNMVIAGEADNGRAAVEKTLELVPDIVIMDINMPGLNGIEATRRILGRFPRIKVIALSMFSERRYVMGMLKAGVAGYLLKNCASEELTDAVNTVFNGSRYLSRQITDMVMDDFVAGRSLEQDVSSKILSSREREILQLTAEGFTCLQIAARLHISEKTVSTHRRRVMDKLNIHSIAGLTKFARQGRIDLSG